MEYYFLSNSAGLLLQGLSALLMAALCAVLMRTVHRPPLRDWSLAWVAMFVSFVFLWLRFKVPGHEPLWQWAHRLSEYVYGYFIIAGCRRYAGWWLPRAREAWLIVPFALIAWIPAVGGAALNSLLVVHPMLCTVLFSLAFAILRLARPVAGRENGLMVMEIALLLLALNYLVYVPLILASASSGVSAMGSLASAPLYELIIQTMLMLGMVMTVTSDVQHELETANAGLKRAHDHVEQLSRLDPLTSALNRRALATVVREREQGRRALSRGCAAFVDLDGLKELNDDYGHAAGDLALQSVATVLSAHMGPDDLLIRWGGDEFLMLFVDTPESEARLRLGRLNDRLAATALPGAERPIDISVTVGFAAFDGEVSLEAVIAQADARMYQLKKQA